MKSIALFVDAGFYIHQLYGQFDDMVTLDMVAAKDIACETVISSFPDHSFLRCYWYDGPGRNDEEKAVHEKLSGLNNFRLCLGWRTFSESHPNGQQKGVDSMITCDMLMHAFHKSVTDIVVLTGDLDILPAVLHSQDLGLRVHLMAVVDPFLKISRELQEQVDTTIILRKFKVKQACQKTLETAPVKIIKTATPIKVAQKKKPQNLKSAIEKKETGKVRQPFLKTLNEVIDFVLDELSKDQHVYMEDDKIPEALENKIIVKILDNLGMRAEALKPFQRQNILKIAVKKMKEQYNQKEIP